MKKLFENGVVVGSLLMVGILGLIFGFVCLEGWIFMLLWNTIVVKVFAISEITFWQGLGIMAICNILIKSGTTIIQGKK